jgi:Lon protease-like protein
LLPLHVFEPRYRKLVADRLEDDRPFGMTFGTDQDHAQIGCAVHIAAVLQKLPDGRLNILTRGYRRFRIVGPLRSDAPYALVSATWVEDEEERVVAELVERARGLFRMAGAKKGWGINLPVDVERDPARLSWLLGEAMHLTNEARQELLELTSAGKRLEAEARWLNALLTG